MCVRAAAPTLVLVLSLVTASAQAQDVADMSPAQIDAADIIAASAVGAGMSADIAISMGTCFGANMSDAEALALAAAQDVETQQEVTSTMAAYDDAVRCMAGQIELGTQ